MKKWQILAAVGAAAGVAAAVMAGKKPAEKSAAPKGKSAPAKKGYVIKTPQTGVYSFVSGFKDAATIDVELTFDAEKHSFAVIEEGFLAYTSDSHAAVIYSDAFNLQLEYSEFYPGEDFAILYANTAEKYKTVEKVNYEGVEGFKYVDGDCIRMCFPAGDDAYSYLLVTALKGPGNDDELVDLPENAELKAVLATMKVSSKK